VDFRLDMFKTFDDIQWGAPDNYLTGNTLDQITSTRPAVAVYTEVRFLECAVRAVITVVRTNSTVIFLSICRMTTYFS